MGNDPIRILILGGTADARHLAERLENDARYAPITSLAGTTRAPSEIAGKVRVGGFGGVEGLADFVGDKNIALVVDATHPFAAQISANAAQAGAKTGVPCLRLERPPWAPRDGDNWTNAGDIQEAVHAIPTNARVFLTIGRNEAAKFFTRREIHLVARMIDPPDVSLPDHVDLLPARPPFTLDAEKALMVDKRITVLVAKNSGGPDTYAKIEAARALGVPVIMIARPQKPDLATASNVDEMSALIAQLFA
jgi:precorrin-6A/cobalt-precorrin-6A reductase